ncbi:hypothetical protein [Arthrobacter sp. DR-2P]|nr:hypothetical protein [Arthrobacter sp. DR-2P]
MPVVGWANGITGRIGYRGHLLRSILPIPDAGAHCGGP